MQKFLTDHLEFYPAGDAITIGREVNPNLALVRIGPYTLNAREKGSKGDYDIEVTIYTVTHFFLKNGKEVNGPQVKGVVKFTEDFDSIAVAKSETPMRADKAN